MNAVQNFPPYFYKVSSNIILFIYSKVFQVVSSIQVF